MKKFKIIATYAILLPLLFIQYSCDNTSYNSSTTAIVGTWKLTGLSGTYIRDVAVPEGTDAATTYPVIARWPYDPTVSGADQTLTTYSTGDTVLNQTSDAAAAISVEAVGLVGEFKKNDTYTLVGTYPALRIVEEACSTYQTIADIDDDGSYNITYNSDFTVGTLSITPLPGTEQVLPSFPDGTVTFSNEGQTMNIVFLDRDAHEAKISEISETWVESDNRKTHGIAQLPIDATGGFFTADATQPLGTEGYVVMSPLLSTWSNFYTYNAVMFNGCLAGGVNVATCAALYATDDSDHVLILQMKLMVVN